jgi:hypothetical protein
VRQTADEILARPEFQEESPTLLDRIWDAISEAVGDVFSTLVGGGGPAVLAWLILALIVGIIAFLLVRLGRTVQADPAQAVRVGQGRRRPPAEWLRDAEAFEANGDWREGLRCRYRALVVELVARRVVPDVPGRTAGEYRREVAEASPDVASAFARATELFELAWYGHRDTGPDESRRFQSLADEVRAGARARVGVAG